MNYPLLTLLLMGAILMAGLGLVYSQHQNRQLFIELQKLQAQRDDLDVEWELLQLEESTLNTELVVEQAAYSRLNMLPPNPKTVIYVMR